MNISEDKLKLDEIDLKILRILQTKGRITNAKLASEVGLSAPPMLERVKKLERSGLIKGYCGILDPKLLGRDFFVFVTIDLDVCELAHVQKFEKSLSEMPEVMECHHIAGDIDFLLKVNVYDQEHYKRFVSRKLAVIPGINCIHSWVVLSTIKDTTELDIPSWEYEKGRV